jgi:hypothetical protein
MNRFSNSNFLYDWISCVIPNRIYFGPIPNDHMIHQLKEKNFNIIVNVTENEIDYGPDFKSFHFPIKDNSIPDNIFEYCKFVIELKKEFETNKNKMYIHCRGGHGRSSMITISLLCCLYNEELKHIINKVIGYHKSRIVLRDIWRIKSPINYKQFMFLCMIHKNIYINVDSDSKIYNWLSPKNIWIDPYKTLNHYVEEFTVEMSILTELILPNINFINKFRYTYLQKFHFIFKYEKKMEEFYNHFFKNLREKII